MDRFSWIDGSLSGEEQMVHQQNGVRLYDGEQKTAFDHGRASITTHRLVWRDQRDQKVIMSLPLSLVIYSEEQSGSLTKSCKEVVHLAAPPAYRPPGPVSSSSATYIRLSFKEGGEKDFHSRLTDVLGKKEWLQNVTTSVPSQPVTGTTGRPIHAGIGGIQKKMQQKHKETDKDISKAFGDLDKLMDKAKEMVTLSKNISAKIRDKQGDITEDETVRFKSYLLSLGISDPVTRDTHGNGDNYYRQLAKQLSDMLQKPLQECGGIMTLTDVYCRVNRARGMELLSPEDLVNGCKLMEQMQLPVRLKIFESGVMVLQLLTHSEEKIVQQTAELIEDKGHLTPEELSRMIGLSVILSKERLLSAEKAGKACRDESSEGLSFFPNLFITHAA